jgi:hypothetical protein
MRERIHTGLSLTDAQALAKQHHLPIKHRPSAERCYLLKAPGVHSLHGEPLDWYLLDGDDLIARPNVRVVGALQDAHRPRWLTQDEARAVHREVPFYRVMTAACGYVIDQIGVNAKGKPVYAVMPRIECDVTHHIRPAPQPRQLAIAWLPVPAMRDTLPTPPGYYPHEVPHV